MVAPEAGVLPQELAFVDLETTGGNAAHHRITEVGIVRMRDGVVIEEWSSLVNPECYIPPYIESLTGISNDMVAAAPRFAEIAALVLDKLHGVVFVAHNARFDYAFLRTEFKRLNIDFSSDVLCTVKLSRRLFPEFARHNLDSVMQRHGLICTARHRALGDARVLVDFWTALRATVAAPKLGSIARLVVGLNRLPAHLPPHLADELPEGPGVYRLYGEGGTLLYVGRSRCVRTRVLGHFAPEDAACEQKKARDTRHIDWVETAGELGAQLTELAWIRSQKPLFNKRPQEPADSHTLRIDPHGRIAPVAIDSLDAAQITECYGVFHRAKDAGRALAQMAAAHGLCLKVLGIEDGPGSCVAYQNGRCKGACAGTEASIAHRLRTFAALAGLKIARWPFPGRVALKEGRTEHHVVDRWRYLGTARCAAELAELCAMPMPTGFDVDVYRILRRYLTKHPDAAWHDLRAQPRAVETG
ncbi:MAG: exonuclease domain-containing protein [Pseudomonadota bacterium]|nr:exonuclease domain-containing protein [Pseudomonadota bacterium]